MEQNYRILEYMKIYEPDINEKTALVDIQNVLTLVRNYINSPLVDTAVESNIAYEILSLYRGIPNGITALREGDTTLTFAKETGYKSILENLKQVLYPYRKLI